MKYMYEQFGSGVKVKLRERKVEATEGGPSIFF